MKGRERWKQVPGWEGLYSQSTHGRTRNDRTNKVLKPCPNGKYGYLIVGLWRKGRGKIFYAHQLTLLTFVGPCPVGMECRHKDGNPGNNCISNLQWGTPKQNSDDKKRHGTMCRGTSNGNARLTEDIVRQVRKLAASKTMRQVDIGKRFGLLQSAVSAIHRRQAWGHVDD